MEAVMILQATASLPFPLNVPPVIQELMLLQTHIRTIARSVTIPREDLPLVLPPTVLGFYLLLFLGPDGPLGRLMTAAGGRPLAFTFTPTPVAMGTLDYYQPAWVPDAGIIRRSDPTDVPSGYSCFECDDADGAVHPGAPEINDGLDNQCPGDAGYGQIDELEGALTVAADEVCWDPQPGAAGVVEQHHQVAVLDDPVDQRVEAVDSPAVPDHRALGRRPAGHLRA